MIITELFLYINSYAANEDGRVGVYVTANPLTPDNNYFEVEILDTGMMGAIGKLVHSLKFCVLSKEFRYTRFSLCGQKTSFSRSMSPISGLNLNVSRSAKTDKNWK